MMDRQPNWQHTAWTWTAHYWSVVSSALVLLPFWVMWINREDDFSSGDQFGLIASLVPAGMGLLLAFWLHRLTKLATTNPGRAGDYGQTLGVGLVTMALAAMIVSLATLTAIFFIAFIPVLLVPAGLFAGTSAELVKAAEWATWDRNDSMDLSRDV